MFSYFAHRKAWYVTIYPLLLPGVRSPGFSRAKQDARSALIQEIGYPDMNKPMPQEDLAILNKPISQVAAEVQSGQLNPVDVLSTYTRKAIRAHVVTNCLTEILVSSAKRYAGDCNRKGPLAGVPISLKDVSHFLHCDRDCE
jgi:hypothetical protein